MSTETGAKESMKEHTPQPRSKTRLGAGIVASEGAGLNLNLRTLSITSLEFHLPKHLSVEGAKQDSRLTRRRPLYHTTVDKGPSLTHKHDAFGRSCM